MTNISGRVKKWCRFETVGKPDPDYWKAETIRELQEKDLFSENIFGHPNRYVRFSERLDFGNGIPICFSQ